MLYSLLGQDGQSSITVFHNGETLIAHSTHPNFNRIVEAVMADDESVVELFDVSQSVAKKFDRLSERVTVAHGQIYFDGTIVDNSLTKQVVRFLDEGVEDFKPLVNFMEKVEQNQSEHSREQLFEWLNRHDFTITTDGDFIAYKGVRADFTSIHRGPAIVNGEAVNGNVPNPLGAVVEIDRSKVQFNPGIGCASGLHAGTWDYAHGFAQGATLKVKINPRDVVSVPTDCDAQKLRVCRYTVLEQVEAPDTLAYAYDADDDDWSTDTMVYCEGCDELFDADDLVDGLCEDCEQDCDCDLCRGF